MAQVTGLQACTRDALTLTRIAPLLSDRPRPIQQGKARPLKLIKGQSSSCRIAPGHLLPVRAAATRRGSSSSTNGVAASRRPRADPWQTVADRSSFVSDDGYPPSPGQGRPGLPEAAGPQQQQRRKLRVGEMAADMKRIRAQMEEDEQVASLMRGLRGQNLRDEQFADADVTMRLVQVETGRGDAEDALPLVYDPQAIADYWGRRPWAVAQRMAQLTSVSGGFLSGVAWDLVRGKVKENEVQRARELREIVTSLGPAYIKLGQALSIRPDVLSPAAMVELQKLCDKVPSFDTEVAMALIEEELGRPPSEIFSELTPSPIAAASLGQVYRGRLRETGEEVAVKVQRPYVLETVTIDLFIIRRLGVALRGVPQIATDVVGLVDEWAARFFEELDYVNEARNTQAFAESMAVDLPQVVVPRTYFEYTSRRVLVTEWINGEKLSQSTADDVGSLVNVGVICYLKQLLDTGLFHADPHPGNLIRTPDGRLCVLDFGLMTRITEDQKYGMIEAISHLIHRDYNAIVEDFVLLDFIPEGVNLTPIMPVLARVFDQALEGGGAKGINFQELAADLAQITFEYPFRIPPYFALIIRAIGVLEGIALVGDPDFAIVDAAYPYIAKRLLTDPSPRLRAALRYTIYGNSGVFDADRFIDVMEAFETFATNSQAGKGSTYLPPAAVDLDLPAPSEQLTAETSSTLERAPPAPESGALGPPAASFPPLVPSSLPFPLPLPFPVPSNDPILTSLLGTFSTSLSASPDPSTTVSPTQARAALAFVLSPEGSFFRDLILDEVVKALDAYSREQISALAHSVLPRNGSGGLFPLPLFFPSPLASAAEALVPRVSEEDRAVLASVRRVLEFLSAGTGASAGGPASSSSGQLLLPAAAGQLSDSEQQQRLAVLVTELSPLLPTVAAEVAPEIATRLSSRVAARFLRDVFLVD